MSETPPESQTPGRQPSGEPAQPGQPPPPYQPPPAPAYQPPPAPAYEPPPPAYQPPPPQYAPPQYQQPPGYAPPGYAAPGYAAPAAGGRPAGFWIRVVAYLIDAIILGIVNFALGSVLKGSGASTGLSTLISLVYFAVLWSSIGGGATLGMRALGLKVIGADGQPVNLGRAVLRYIGLAVSVLILLIGVIMVAFTDRKRGLHDMIAGTYVVHTR